MWSFLNIFVLSGICLSFFKIFDLKVGVDLPIAPTPGSTTDKVHFVNLSVWLVVVVGIAVAMDYFLCLL